MVCRAHARTRTTRTRTRARVACLSGRGRALLTSVRAYALTPPKGLAPGPASLAQASAELVVLVDPTMISVAHWGRLDNGELLARARYVDGATLMKRSFGVDVLTCPRGSRKLRVLATLTDPATIRRILEHLEVRSEPLAEGGEADSCFALGVMVEGGQGAALHQARAIELFRRSCERGYAEGCARVKGR